jgi:hypothetical protein
MKNEKTENENEREMKMKRGHDSLHCLVSGDHNFNRGNLHCVSCVLLCAACCLTALFLPSSIGVLAAYLNLVLPRRKKDSE